MKAPKNCNLKRNVIYEGCQSKLLFVQLILIPYTGSNKQNKAQKKQVRKSSLYSLYIFWVVAQNSLLSSICLCSFICSQFSSF